MDTGSVLVVLNQQMGGPCKVSLVPRLPPSFRAIIISCMTFDPHDKLLCKVAGAYEQDVL